MRNVSESLGQAPTAVACRPSLGKFERWVKFKNVRQAVDLPEVPELQWR
jgi:hypothetical protein